MKKTQKILLIVAIAILIAIIVFLGYGYIKKATEVIKNPIVTMEVEGYGTVKMELYPDMAPNTVAHFVKKVNEGYYNGLTFHRTIPNFMIQGGDKDGTGATKLDYALPGEFIANGFTKNTLKHTKGVLSMARADYSSYAEGLTKYSYNSAGTQFFIMAEDIPTLDGYYTAFGKVIEGIEVIDKIKNVEVKYRSSELKEGEEPPKDDKGNPIPSDRPINPPVIKSMTVDTFGVEYGEPETVAPFDYYDWFTKTYGYDLKTLYGIE